MRRNIKNILRGYSKKFKSMWHKDHAPIIELKEKQGSEILNRENVLAAGLEYDFRNPDTLLEDKNFDLTIYDRMLLDDRVKFVFELKKMMALNISHSVIAASEEDKDIEIAEFVQTNFDRLEMPTFDGILDNLLDSIAYGFKCGEVILEQYEGKWVWDKIKFQHPILFDFEYDDQDNLENVRYGYYYGDETKIPVKEFNEKFIIMVYPYLKDGNWYGDSELKEIYFEWWSKYNIKRWRNEFIQGRGKPVPHIIIDSAKITDDEKNEVKDMFENWQDNMYVIIPGFRDEAGEIQGKFTVDWVSVGTKENVDLHNETLIHIDKSITRKMLFPDRMGFTDDGTGSFAQSKQIFDFVIMNIKQLHKRLEDVINPKVRQLVDLNFPNVKEYPKWQFQEVDRGIEKEILQLLLEKKVIDRREGWIRSYVNIPELTEQEKEEIEEAQEEDRANMPDFTPKDETENEDIKDDAVKKEEKLKFKTADAPVNFKKIEAQYDVFEQDFLDVFDPLYARESLRLVKQVEKSGVYEDEDIGVLEKLRIKKTDFKKAFQIYYFKLYLSGKKDAHVELKPRIQETDLELQPLKLKAIEFDDKWLDKDWMKGFLKEMGVLGVLTKEDRKVLKNLKDRAFLDAGELEDTMTKITERTVSSGLRNGLTEATISEQIKGFLKQENQRFATTIARTNASTDYNSGRLQFFNSEAVKNTIEAYQYSAIIDGQTTPFCTAHDGQIIKTTDPTFESINPPNHFNCRSLLIPILITDSENPDSFYQDYEEKFPVWGMNKNSEGTKSNMGDPKVNQPARGFGGTV